MARWWSALNGISPAELSIWLKSDENLNAITALLTSGDLRLVDYPGGRREVLRTHTRDLTRLIGTGHFAAGLRLNSPVVAASPRKYTTDDQREGVIDIKITSRSGRRFNTSFLGAAHLFSQQIYWSSM